MVQEKRGSVNHEIHLSQRSSLFQTLKTAFRYGKVTKLPRSKAPEISKLYLHSPVCLVWRCRCCGSWKWWCMGAEGQASWWGSGVCSWGQWGLRSSGSCLRDCVNQPMTPGCLQKPSPACISSCTMELGCCKWRNRLLSRESRSPRCNCNGGGDAETGGVSGGVPGCERVVRWEAAPGGAFTRTPCCTWMCGCP